MLAVVVGEVERERQVQSGMGRRQVGSGPGILSHIYNSLLAPRYLQTPLSQQSPAGNCTVLGHQWHYRKKTQINSQGVFPLLGRGRDCLTAATSRILQLNCAIPGNLYRVGIPRKTLSIQNHRII